MDFELGSLTKGVSKAEHDYISSVTSGKKLLDNPVYAVHKIPTYALFKLDVNRVAAYRAISGLFYGNSCCKLLFYTLENGIQIE